MIYRILNSFGSRCLASRILCTVFCNSIGDRNETWENYIAEGIDLNKVIFSHKKDNLKLILNQVSHFEILILQLKCINLH